LYVAGWRVNLLLASSPAALQIDPPTDDRDLLLGITRRKEFSRRILNVIHPVTDVLKVFPTYAGDEPPKWSSHNADERF
jgi:hypothetical protein